MVRVLSGAVACAPAVVANAGQLSVGGSASQQFQYEDNVSVETAGNKLSTGASISTLGLNASNSTAVWDVGANALLTFSRFFEDSKLDSDDQTIGATAGYKTSSSEWRLKGSVIRDTTRTSDLAGTGQFILANKRRDLFSGGPSWTYQLDPVDTITASSAFTYVNYPNGGDQLVGYEQASGDLGFDRKLSGTVEFLAQLSTFYYKTTNIGDLESTYVAPLFGAAYTPSAVWQASLLIGPSVTVSSGSVSSVPGGKQEGAEAGYGLQADLSYLATDDITLRADVTRTAAPNVSNASLEELTTFTLSYTQFLLPKTSVYVNGIYTIQDQVKGDEFSRDYVSFESGVRFNLTHDWSAWTGYRLQWQERQSSGSSSTSGTDNMVLGRLSYAFPTWSEAP